MLILGVISGQHGGAPRWGRVWGTALRLASLMVFLPMAPALAQEGEDDEAAYHRALGERAFRENCLICHAPDLVTRQRLSEAQWRAEVTKMVGWGAPVPPDELEDLTNWLIAEFPLGKPLAPAPRVNAVDVRGRHAVAPAEVSGSSGDDGAGQALFTQHCANCHGATAQGSDLGPNLVERPVLFRDGDWRGVIRDGRRRMPGYAAVLSDDQSAAIHAWLRNRVYTAAP